MALDESGMRTMFIGLFGGTLLYGLGFAARMVLPEPWNLNVWTTFTFLGLMFLVGWYFAVRRGFRVRRLGRKVGRAEKRRKERERQGPPPWMRR